ncbi:metalloregulator ArsR/SmtB family transcription factor [Paenibacillus sp. NEAU-GSW1]|uniref:ArsR/SmtB family transcription factor n=1 Tax=Paenibacillus sp. NEAU-GSW1 TaxID=2682486 RepID=UPI0012E21AFC|nr:metalloregulator ArsR/SmtB family transcription factor [Paenibacillus sp. NEAU-GSW1]MUT68754.1 metalloregulator ArsR/SmtB family transcription factor [Paenibacillus sp. NEAU-GSW1]
MDYELPMRHFKDNIYRQFARIGKCLSSDKRLELLDLLSQGPKSVEKLAQATAMSVANVSRHLQILLDANLVKFSKKGTFVIYSLTSPEINVFLSSLWRISELQLAEVLRIKADFINHFDHLQTLSLEEVLHKMEEGSIMLLDVRPADEYEAEHIPGAVSVPIEELHHYIQGLPKNVQIAAYCRGPYCIYSAQAVEQMLQEGFSAFRLVSGIQEWQEHQSQTH